MINLQINNDITTTVRELEPGQLYITRTAYEKVKRGQTKAEWEIKKRTDSPFRSLTLLGAKVRSFPSEKVYTVEEL